MISINKYISINAILAYILTVTINSAPDIQKHKIDSLQGNESSHHLGSVNWYNNKLDSLTKEVNSNKNEINAMNKWNIDGKNNLLITTFQFVITLIIILIVALVCKSKFKILTYRKEKMNDDSSILKEIIDKVKNLQYEISQIKERMNILDNDLNNLEGKIFPEKNEEIIDCLPSVEKAIETVLYSASPEPDGYFVEKNLKSIKENVSLYRIKIDNPNSNKGIIELILDNPDVVKRALSAVQYYLEPACDYYLDINKATGSIKQESIGIVDKTVKGWKVSEKIKISFM